jgi:hypothetical protein
MKPLMLIPLIALIALPSLALTDAWSLNINDHTSVQRTYKQGESIDMRIILRNGLAPLDLTGATARFYWFTNTTANVWWTNSVTISAPKAGLVESTWTPAMDTGAPMYYYWIGVWQVGATSPLWRVTGNIRMLPSPGFTPNALPMPVRTLDLSGLTVVNAPWVTAADWASGSNALASAIQSIPPDDSTRWWSADRSTWMSRQGGSISEYTVTSTNRWYVQCVGTPVTNGTFEVLNAPALFTTNGIWTVNAPGVWGASTLTNSANAVSVSIAVPWNNYYATQLPPGLTSYRLYTGAGVQGTVTLYRVSSVLTNSLSYVLPQRALPTNAVPGWLLYDTGSNVWLQVSVSNLSFTVWEVH